MKIAIIGILVSLNLCMTGCTCPDCMGDEDMPQTWFQQVAVFDTLGPSGFTEAELDSVYMHRFINDVQVIDTVRLLIERDGSGVLQNVLSGRTFGHIDSENNPIRMYEIEVRNQPGRYRFRDFDVRIIPNDPKNRCDCDGSVLERVTVNDSIIDVSQGPYMIRK